MLIGMTEDIRAELRAELARRGESFSKAAKSIGTSTNQVSRMIGANRSDTVGDVSDVWQKLLHHLGYELTLKKIED